MSSFLYHKLPEAIHDDFVMQYGLDKLSITKRVYQEPIANVFLGQFHDLHWKSQIRSVCSGLVGRRVQGIPGRACGVF